MSSYLNELGRFDESRPFWAAVSDINGKDAVSTRVLYWMERAGLASMAGNAAEAYGYYERALHDSEEETDPYRVTIIWQNYSNAATTLGDIERAKSCMERALLIARQNKIILRIAHICVLYADILRKIGHYSLAQGY